uniref:Uncharacterized protein n=1 Tax=Panagrolaimus sp. PS1159 TaxID=55785 RepID=A0AC35FK04_9BILA
MLFQLLCPCTKEFGFHRSRITPNILFSDIIKKAPNLVDISMDFETIFGSKTWIKDLLKYKNGNNFKSSNVKLDIVALDVESLVEFIKTKCCQPRDMFIWFD